MSPAHRNRSLTFNDVTLRDGEQAPGNTMDPETKRLVAEQLVRMGIPAIEAGFPAASRGDFASVEQIAAEIGPRTIEHPSGSVHPRISGLARLVQRDIEHAMLAVRAAPHRGVHTFISTSQEQLIKFSDAIRKRGGNPASLGDFIDRVVLPSIEENFAAIRSGDPDAVIQFSPEDWTRTEESVSDEVVLAAAQNGARVINLPDTVGIGIPRVIGTRVAHVRELLDRHGFPHVTISWHGHNDTGQGVANAIEAMYGGAEQFETTILGIGERTGNYSFEAMLAALDANKAMHERIIGGTIRDSIVRKEVMRTAVLVSQVIGQPIPREHPIVGENAFAHESGIHQQGVVAGRANGQMVYEILRPEDYGAESKLILGKHSGWAGLKDWMDRRKLPYREEHREAFRSALDSAGDARRKGLSDEEVLDQVYYPTVVSLTGGPVLQDVRAKGPADAGRKSVQVALRDGRIIAGKATAEDEGAVDALVHALRQLLPGIEVTEFSIRKKPGEEGASAPAIATVTLHNGFSVSASAESHDTEHAGVLAVQKAFNALWAMEQYASPQDGEPAAQ